MKKIFASLLVVLTAMLYGCGGSGTTPSLVSGTASHGAAIAEGTPVTLKDANGKIATSKVGASGFYSVPVDGLTAPYVMNTGGFYSFASAAGTTNINPFTHLSMQIALGTSTLNDSTAVPANFQTQFSSAVSDLKAKIDGLYPKSVTQRDFLSGNIILEAGVDKVLGSVTITPPDASGVFTMAVNGQQILSGTMLRNGGATITPDSTAITSVMNSIFPVSNSSKMFTLAMISGKSFITDSGIATFNADGTLTGDGPNTSSETWTINSSGQLVIYGTGKGTGTFTLISGDATQGWTGSATFTNGTADIGTFVPVTATGANKVFTTAMISGKSFTTGSSIATFNADGTLSGNGTNSSGETWTINSSGQLVIYGTGKGTGTFTLISGDATHGWTFSIGYSNGTSTATTGTLVPVNVFTLAMLSGKTFAYTGGSGKTGTMTFSADGAGWSINSAGQLILSSSSYSGEVDTLTLTSSTATTLAYTDAWTSVAAPTSGTGSGILTFVN